MKRLSLSLIGGLGFPCLYAIMAGPLSLFIESYAFRQILYAPIGWSRLAYFYLAAFFHPHTLHIKENTFIAIIILCNVLFYSVVTYVVLSLYAGREARAKIEEPPLPPEKIESIL